MNKVTQEEAIESAASLFEPGALHYDNPEHNPEYTRGVLELLAEMFPTKYVPTGERAEQFREPVNDATLER